ncbi:MAG: prepilin-type N-terminal cleavage/methylation domain-containing protein [Phycisphaerae bacterium]|jgi:prepilin-type N-terminal cleavage/methylation domain-containing protein|nr:prepilin-type N-terminal cleavage/methylation domain-containing protein [Phycisphaerae bacterium]
MRESDTSRAAAFTLVELLVSIIVIGLLAALATPALQRGMAMAHQSKCRSNMHFQAQAHILYGSNNHFNKPPIIWKYSKSFGHALVSPNVKVLRQPVGQGILVQEKYIPLRTILCPASFMAEDAAADEDAWIKRSISGSSYSYFWRHSASYKTKQDLLSEYKYSDAQREGRYGVSMDFNSREGHSYIGAYGPADWPSHPLLGLVNIAYSDGSVQSEDNSKIVLRPPFNLVAKLKWWDLAHEARP